MRVDRRQLQIDRICTVRCVTSSRQISSSPRFVPFPRFARYATSPLSNGLARVVNAPPALPPVVFLQPPP